MDFTPGGDFDRRLSQCHDERKWLYCELCHKDMEAFRYFCGMLRNSWPARKEALRIYPAERKLI